MINDVETRIMVLRSLEETMVKDCFLEPALAINHGIEALKDQAATITQLEADKAETNELFRRIDWFCSAHSRRENRPANAALSFEVAPTMGGAFCAEMYITSDQNRNGASDYCAEYHR